MDILRRDDELEPRRTWEELPEIYREDEMRRVPELREETPELRRSRLETAELRLTEERLLDLISRCFELLEEGYRLTLPVSDDPETCVREEPTRPLSVVRDDAVRGDLEETLGITLSRAFTSGPELRRDRLFWEGYVFMRPVRSRAVIPEREEEMRFFAALFRETLSRLIRVLVPETRDAFPEFLIREESTRERTSPFRLPENVLLTVLTFDRSRACAATRVLTLSRFTAGRISGCREESEILFTFLILAESSDTREIRRSCSWSLRTIVKARECRG